MIVRMLAILVFGFTLGCEQKVTEYHRRPSFYRLASESELVDEYVDKDGHKVVLEIMLLPMTIHIPRRTKGQMDQQVIVQ